MTHLEEAPGATPEHAPDMWDWLTIVPEAHTHIFDRPLQVEMYAVFHIHPVCRASHLLATPTILVSTMALLQIAAGPRAGLALSAGLGLVQIANAVWLDRRLGLPIAALSAALVALSAALAGGSASVWLALIGAATLVQVLSHTAEPIPPPWSGHPGWCPLGQMVRERGLWRLPGLLPMLLASLVLELWAAYRIMAYQVFQLMLTAGYRPALGHALWARRAHILGDCRRGWGPDALDAQRVSL